MRPCVNCSDVAAWYAPTCPACTRLGALGMFIGGLLAGLASRWFA